MYTADELEIRRALAGSPRSEQLIACLEGEIAKRDARIVELESRYQRDVYGLNNEGDPIGGDPAGGYANDNARLRTELAALKAHGNYAPASVVWIDAHHVIEGNNPSFIKDVALVSAERTSETQIPLARLNAAPVQRVSVPDERIIPTSAELIQWAWEEEPEETRFQEGYNAAKRWVKMQIEAGIAAPEAPVADAGLVDALEMIINPIEAMRRELQGGEQLNGMVAMQLASDPEYLRGVAKAALAAHRAKGVV